MRQLSILGSTGSVGENTLRVVRIHPERFSVKALAVKKNFEKLYEQAVEFRPKVVCIYDAPAAKKAAPKKVEAVEEPKAEVAVEAAEEKAE